MSPRKFWLSLVWVWIGLITCLNVQAHNVMPSIVGLKYLADHEISMTVEVSQDVIRLFSTESDPLKLFEKQFPTLLKWTASDGKNLSLDWQPQTSANPNLDSESKLSDYKFIYNAKIDGDIGSIRVEWPESLGDAVLKVQNNSTEDTTLWLKGGTASEAFTFAMKAQQSFWDFVIIGFEHILPEGTDHILFIIGLYFFSTKFRSLLLQISAFTIAHTATLGLATFGLVSLDAAIVEPIIALSISFVAIENLRHENLSKWRLGIVFLFGLLHGLGFAGALFEIDIDSNNLVRNLLAFNIGIELGQLFIVAMLHALLGHWLAHRSFWNSKIKIPVSILIAVVGFYWFAERILINLK